MSEHNPTPDRGLAAMQMLFSHLCHELVSPVGAVNNGVELLEETGGAEMDREALSLIAESGRTAAAKLRFFRYAYGSAGRAADFRLRDAQAATRELFAGESRTQLDWPDQPEAELAAGGVQLLSNLALLAAGFLPRGGTIAVAFAPGEAGLTVTLASTGTGARIPEAIRKILEVGRAVIDHKTVHADYCRRLAVQLDVTLTLSEEAERTTIIFTLPMGPG